MRTNTNFLLFFVLLTLFFICFASPLIQSASQDGRMVYAFSMDESLHLRVIREALERNSLWLNYEEYGHLFLNSALLPLFFLQHFFPISDHCIILTLRFISAFFAWASILAVFVFARRLYGPWAAWFSGLLFTVLPLNFFHWSVTSHPDTMQIFFIILSLYACCEMIDEKKKGWFYFASLSAGLAFASKYSGIFILPLIASISAWKWLREEKEGEAPPAFPYVRNLRLTTAFFAILFLVSAFSILDRLPPETFILKGRLDNPSHDLFLLSLGRNFRFGGVFLLILALFPFFWSFLSRHEKMRGFVHQMTICLAIFTLTFFITSPRALVRLNFLENIFDQSYHTAFGHIFKEQGRGLGWIAALFSHPLLDPLIFVLACFSITLCFWNILKKRNEGNLLKIFFLWAWGLFYIAFLIFRVNMFSYRTLLPVVPVLLILSSYPFFFLMKGRWKNTQRIGKMLILLTIFFEVMYSGNRLIAYRRQTLHKRIHSEILEAGRWLGENYPSEFVVMTDAATYVPEKFQRTYAKIGWSLNALRKIKPDLIVMNDNIAFQYQDTNLARDDAEGEESFYQKRAYYDLLKGKKSGYKKVKSFKHLMIFQFYSRP